MKIDFNDETPRYQQLINILIRMMKDGQFQPGDRIPSENELTEQLSVSRTTVRQALNELVQQGLLEKRKGQGTFYLGEDSQKPRNQTNLIGVIMPSLSYTIYPHIIRGIEEVAHQHNYNVIFGNSNADNDKEIRLLEQMVERHVDGLVIEPSLSAQLTQDKRTFKMLKNLKFPFVLVDNLVEGLDASYVVLDDISGGFTGTEYLIRKGHTKIALIYKNVVRAGVDRKDGYQRALRENGIPVRDEYIKSYTEEDEAGTPAYDLTSELLAQQDRPTAIFYFNDETALLGYPAIRDSGLKVGDDVSVLGFDDSPAAVSAEVPLTTLTHPKFYMGKWAADILFDEISGKDPTVRNRLLIRPSIVERSSVRTLS